ncbi:MAG: hypothetical protein NW207_04290 [Cytophagales bacterium]|nr:hypothetical protein [Cytophagales bacterium]
MLKIIIGILLTSFAAALLVLHIKIASLNIDAPLNDKHGFRQCQTAISIYYYLKDGAKIIYETPVLGPPWTIPFEFPTYQYIVYKLIGITDYPIEKAGRMVNIAFFFMSICVVVFTMYLSGCNFYVILFTVISILSFCTYMFWNRTLLIENTALFFSVAFICCLILYDQYTKLIYLILALICGVLASLTKVTTFILYDAAVVMALAVKILPLKKINISIIINAIKQNYWYMICITIPILIGAMWVKISDYHKSLSYGGKYLVSAALSQWNYGLFESRFILSYWSIYFPAQSNNSILIAYILLIMNILYNHKYRIQCLILIISYFMGPVVFLNLYFHHDYYWAANTLILAVAMAFTLYSMYMHHNIYIKYASIVLLIGWSAFQGYMYKVQYFDIQRYSNTMYYQSGNEMSKIIPENECALLLVDGWSSELPYYLKRKTYNLDKSIFEYTTSHTRAILDSMYASDTKYLILRVPYESKLMQKINDLYANNTQILYKNTNFELYKIK